MNFKSQICTTKEQSKRLLALGLKAETADMKYPYEETIYWGTRTGSLSSLPKILNSVGSEIYEDDLPAWSLHRLLLMLPEYIDKLEAELAVNQSSCGYTNDDEWVYFTEESNNIYDNIITCIEWLIKVGYFNKEYLN